MRPASTVDEPLHRHSGNPLAAGNCRRGSGAAGFPRQRRGFWRTELAGAWGRSRHGYPWISTGQRLPKPAGRDVRSCRWRPPKGLARRPLTSVPTATSTRVAGRDGCGAPRRIQTFPDRKENTDAKTTDRDRGTGGQRVRRAVPGSGCRQPRGCGRRARDNLEEALALFFETAPKEEIERRLRSEVYITRVEVAVGQAPSYLGSPSLSYSRLLRVRRGMTSRQPCGHAEGRADGHRHRPSAGPP